MKLHLPDGHRMFLRVQTAGHMFYFACVFIEAHSIYAYSAGGLFILSVVGILYHEEIV